MARAVGRWALAPVVVLVGLALAGTAGGHEFRPALLDVTEVGDGRFEIAWVPAPDAERVVPVFPSHCAGGEPAPPAGRFSIDCGTTGLVGHVVSIVGLSPGRDEVLVRVHLARGVETSAMLSAMRPSVVIADPSGGGAPPATVGAYAVAGAAHLMTGPDHLLFLLGLLLLLRRPGAVVRAVTAFTLAHSLSLGLQAVGAIRLPPAPVEATIALSVVLLARELLRPAEAGTLVQRRPWLVTFGFGLLHGLGFAGGLAALRVPRGQIPAALLGFNVGLELAQVAVVLVALGLARWLGPGLARARLPAWTRRAPAYSFGAVAVFWLLQRTSAFWDS